MKVKDIPFITLVLCTLMMVLSFYAYLSISGSFFGKIKITDLEPFGGLLPSHIRELELWRLFVSNLIHVKQLHMLFNAISLFLLGCYLENKMGRVQFFLVWLVTGVVGNLAGSYSVPAPWNLGTGGSAANFGLIACALVYYFFDGERTRGMLITILLTLSPAIVLDIIFASYHAPKIGHVVPFFLAFVYGYFMFFGKPRIRY